MKLCLFALLSILLVVGIMSQTLKGLTLAKLLSLLLSLFGKDF